MIGAVNSNCNWSAMPLCHIFHLMATVIGVFAKYTQFMIQSSRTERNSTVDSTAKSRIVRSCVGLVVERLVKLSISRSIKFVCGQFSCCDTSTCQ